MHRARCPAIPLAILVPDVMWGFVMRGALSAISLLVAIIAAAGCHHDKYNLKPKIKEEPYLPPNEKRYNEPETAPYKKPPPPKDEKTLLGRPGPGMGPGMGGFGP